MGKVWDDVINEATGDEKLDDVLDILDFPIESLEDDEFIGDWDASKSLCLGPIPTDVLMAPPIIPKIDTGPPRKPVAKIPEVQEPTVFQMQSPNSVLESSGSHPDGTRSKRARPCAEPGFSRSPMFATEKTYNAMKSRKRMKKRSQPMKRESSRKAQDIFEESDLVFELGNDSDTKKCSHCEVTKTPQWREGPMGMKTLCNACGVRYRTGRLFPEYRPASSPTFVPSLHSNSHKKVIEMRNKGKQKVSEVEVMKG